MILYLARHGRTNYNDLGLCNSDPSVDVHLTPLGVTQSEALADKFKQIPLDRIFASELKRTQQTAEIVNKFHNLEVEIDARLNDSKSGFEGKHYTEYEKVLDAAADRWTVRFNDGESIEDLKKRAADFVNELRARGYDAVLVITSQWVIQAILAVERHLPNDEAWSIDAPQGDYIELIV